jgi:dephospho-CoA kinase
MSGPPVIGLLGGVGSGKSAVAGVFEAMGCIVANADADAHLVLGEPSVQAMLRERWGDGVVLADGETDRTAIGRIVFADPDERGWLESIVHPMVSERRKASFDAAPAGVPALVMDAPLILEAGLDGDCDHLVFIECPLMIREQRVSRTRGWDEGELRRREAAQHPLEEKRLRADFTITNAGDLDSVTDQVSSILSSISEGSSGTA